MKTVSTHGGSIIPQMTLQMTSVSISDAVKILTFIGNTLGIEYELVDEQSNGDGTKNLTVGGNPTEEGTLEISTGPYPKEKPTLPGGSTTDRLDGIYPLDEKKEEK